MFVSDGVTIFSLKDSPVHKVLTLNCTCGCTEVVGFVCNVCSVCSALFYIVFWFAQTSVPLLLLLRLSLWALSWSP